MFRSRWGGALRRVVNALRWRLGSAVVSDELEIGTDESISAYYGARITNTDFLADPGHYERPRSDWIISIVAGGSLLEVGCGDGGMTALLSPRVESITALEISSVSLERLELRGLKNVRVLVGLVETITMEERFDWIVMSEVIEHLRHPALSIQRCYEWLSPGEAFCLPRQTGAGNQMSTCMFSHSSDLPKFSFNVVPRRSAQDS